MSFELGTRGVAGALAMLLVSLVAAPLAAGWTTEPSAVKARMILERMERQLALDDETELAPSVRADLIRAVLAMVKLEGGQRLREPRITLLVAELSLASGSGSAAHVASLFERVIAESPDPSVRTRALLGLGRAARRDGDARTAQSAFSQALDLAWSEERRALLYLERGLLAMRVGKLDAAVADFRRTLLASRTDTLRFEASMLLAVAYERRADLPSALAVVERALLGGRPKKVARTLLGSSWHSDLDLREAAYGEALVAMGIAHSENTPLDKKRRSLSSAVRHWERYLQLTQGASDGFVLNADRLLIACREALERLGPEPAEPPPE